MNDTAPSEIAWLSNIYTPLAEAYGVAVRAHLSLLAHYHLQPGPALLNAPEAPALSAALD